MFVHISYMHILNKLCQMTYAFTYFITVIIRVWRGVVSMHARFYECMYVFMHFIIYIVYM